MWKCEDCGREVSNDRYEHVMFNNGGTPPHCQECHGEFRDTAYLGVSKVMTDYTEYEDDMCIVCGKRNREFIKFDDCHEYGEYDVLVICKQCIDKKYPRKEKIITKEIIKPIRIDREEKSGGQPLFLQKTKYD